MAGEFQLQSLEDEDVSTWECVDTSGKPVAWNTDPEKCLRGTYPPCGSCTNDNCFTLGPETSYVRHVIPAAKIPTEAIGKQVTLTLDAAMWKYINSDPISVYPIQIDIGPASLTVDMAVNTTNSTCEGKRRSISQTFTLPPPGPDGFNFTLWKTSDSTYRTWFDMDNVTLSYDPAIAVGFATNNTVPTQGSQLSTSNSERNRNTGLAIGLGVAALVLAAIAAGLLCWFCKRRKTKHSGTHPEAKEQGSDETQSSLVKTSGAENSSPFTPEVKQESRLSLGGAKAAPKAGGLSPESLPVVLGTNTVTHSLPGPSTQSSDPLLKEPTPSSQDATLLDISTPEVEQSVVSQGLTAPSLQAPVSLLQTSTLLPEQPTIPSLESTLASQEPNLSQQSLVLLPDTPGLSSAEPIVTVSQPISSSQSLITKPFSSDDAIMPEDGGVEKMPRGAQANILEGRDTTIEIRPEAEIATETGHPSLYSTRQTFTQQTHTQGFSFQSSTSSWTTSFSSSGTVQVRNSGGRIQVQTSTRGFSHSG